jgi:hypothetical protein
MNDNYTYPYHDVCCVVFHINHVMRIMFGQKITFCNEEISLMTHSSEKRNFPRGKAAGNRCIRNATVS